MGSILQNKRPRACSLATGCVLFTCFGALAQKAPVGRIAGHIDGIAKDGDHYFLLGWACQQGQSKSVNVQLFATQTTNGAQKEGPVFAETAGLNRKPKEARSTDGQAGSYQLATEGPN